MSPTVTARQRYLLPAILSLTIAACGTEGTPRTASQTNWLRACQIDAQCGDLQCLCGACTRTCSAGSACADLDGGVCVMAEDAGAIALCGGNEPASPGLCLPRCEPEGCPSGTSCVAGVCSPTPEPTVRVTVDSSIRYQTLVGFGATVGYVQNELVRHPEKTALYDAMFSGVGLDVLRVRNSYGYEGDTDLPATREIIDAATESLGRAPTVVLSSWSPPAALKANGSTRCEGNPDTCTLVTLPDGTFDYAGFASHWRASLDAYAAEGVEPDYIGIQNNPNWVPPASSGNEACRFLPAEGTTTVSIGGVDVEVRYPGFGEALDAVVEELSGLASVPKIAAPEATGVETVADYLPSLDVSRVDAIAHHLYGMDPAAVDPEPLEALGDLGQQHQLPLFQTEMQSDGFGTAVLMHYALAVEGASAYLQNDFVQSASLAENPAALITLNADDFTLGLAYHVMRHYALHTDPGWVRVAATSDREDLLVSAWLAPEGDGLTVLLVNPGVTEVDVEIDLGEETLTTSEVTRTVLEGLERSAELGALPAQNVVRVTGRAIVTVALHR